MRGLMRRLKLYRSYLSLVTVLSAITYLVFSTPSYLLKPCDPLQNENIEELCHAILDGDVDVTSYASKYAWCRRQDVLSDAHYQSLLPDSCSRFIETNGYLSHNVTEEELNFPIAFGILMHENVEQVERLLRLIYRPHNVYCIHVDAKSPASVHRAMRAITSCFHNVILSSQVIDIHWGEFSLLEAELLCLRELFNRSEQWRYYVNLMGREFPLRTNKELVQIFNAYDGANDVDGTLHRRPIVWTMFVWKGENWRTSQLKSKPPHKFIIAKGSTHAALSRAFVDYALNSRQANDLLEWMRDIRAPDEHFFPTLNHNPHLGIPGSYRGDPDLKWFYARMKIWQSETEVCHGQWVRYICNLGVGDIARVNGAKQLFVNKIRVEQDPTAYRCLELWYLNRSRSSVNVDFNVSFYADLPFVKDHV